MAAATQHSLHTRRHWNGLERGADIVVIGGRRHALADVVSYEVEAQEDLDNEGQILCSAIYGCAAGALLIGTALGGLDWKLLVGVAFIAAIALMCLADALAVKPVTIYRLVMQMRDGQQTTFAAGEWEVVAALADRIDRLATDSRG